MADKPRDPLQMFAASDVGPAVQAPASISDPRLIRAWQMKVVRKAIKLESIGLRHSKFRGGVKSLWAAHFKMPTRSSPQAVLDRLQAEITKLEQEYADEHRQQQFPLGS